MARRKKERNPQVLDFHDTAYTATSPAFWQKTAEIQASSADIQVYHAILSKINIYTGVTKAPINLSDIAKALDYCRDKVRRSVKVWIDADLLIRQGDTGRFILPDAQQIRGTITELKTEKYEEHIADLVEDEIQKWRRRTGRYNTEVPSYVIEEAERKVRRLKENGGKDKSDYRVNGNHSDNNSKSVGAILDKVGEENGLPFTED